MDVVSRHGRFARERRAGGSTRRVRRGGATVFVLAATLAACRSEAPSTPPRETREAPTPRALPAVPSHAIASCTDASAPTIVADQLSRQIPASAVAISGNGALVVATGGSGTSVWDVRTSRRIDVNAAVRGSHVAFVDGSSEAILTDVDGKLWRWSRNAWRVAADLQPMGITGQILALHSTSRDSAWIVTEYRVHVLRLDDPVRVSHTTAMDRLTAATATANLLAVARAGNGIELIEDGVRVLRRIDAASNVRRIALSSDGARVAWSTEDQRIHVQSTANPTAAPVTFATRIESPVQGLGFDAEGDAVLVATSDGSVVVHDATSGAPIREFPGSSGSFGIDYAVATPFAIAPEGGFLASVAMETVRVHEARTLEPLFTLQARNAFPGELHVSDDGRWLLAGSGAAYVAWDLARLVPRPLLAAATALGESFTSRLYFEGSSSAIIVTDKRLVRVDLESGAVEETVDFPALAGVIDVSYAAAAKTVVRVDASGAVDVFVLGDRTSQRVRPLAAGVVSAVLTGDAGHFVLLGQDGQLVVIPTQSPKDSRVLAQGVSPRSKLQLGRDGTTIVHEHRRWDLHGGAELAVTPRFNPVDDPLLAGFRPPSVGAASHGGRWHVVGDDDGCVRVIDARSGQTQAHARAFTAGTRVASVAGSATTGMVFAAAGDGRVRAWNTTTGASLTLAATPGAWAAWREDGYFAASRLGHELLALRGPAGALDPLRLAAFMNRPGALLRQLGPAGAREDTAGFADILERAAAARLTDSSTLASNGETEASEMTLASSLEVRIAALDAAGATLAVAVPTSPRRADDETTLFVRIDGVRRADLDKVVAADATDVEIRVPIPPGVHVVEVSIASHGVERGIPAVVPVTSPLPPTPGRLLFFGVGASSYADSRIRPLAYADDDVRDFASAMQLAGTSFSGFEAKLLPDGATKAEIDAALGDWVASARAEDTLVIFFAGHGKHVDGEHVLLTHDSRLDALPDTTLPVRRVHELLNASTTLRRILLIDTCESGDGRLIDRTHLVRSMHRAGIDPATARGLDLNVQGDAPSRSTDDSPEGSLVQRLATWAEDRDQLVFAEAGSDAGTVTLVSSRGWEPSLEFASLENGVFSTAVLKALSSPDTDLDEDGAASIDELVFLTTETVALLTRELQHPMLLSSNPRAAIRIPLVGEAASVGRADRSPHQGERVPSDAAVRDLVRRWYERESEFAGAYVFEPIVVRMALRGEQVIAHVFFRYRASETSSVSSSTRRGVDKRWFSLTADANGGWRVTGMGGPMSGLP